METCVGFPKCLVLTLCVVKLVCTCSSSPGLPSMSQGLCVYSVPWACPLCCMACVHCRGLCLPLSWPPRPALCIVRFTWAAEFVHWASLGIPGPPSMPWGFCGLLSVPWACHLVRATVCELFMDWEVQLSLFSALLVPALPGFLRFCSTHLGLPIRELPSARELVRLQNSLPLSEHKLLSRSPSCLPILCLHPLSYLISGSLDCLPWRPGFFCCLLEFAL